MTTVTATELPRVMVCMGSRLMPAAIPGGGDQTARDEGNAAHWLAEQMFNGQPATAGLTAFNGHVITDDMVEHVTNYVTALDCGELEVDTSYAGDRWEVRGRADHLVYSDATDTLTIDDFKYGWRIVEPTRNWTLLSHAIGWVIRHQVRPNRIVLRIHQPRPYHNDGPLREWSCSFDELMGYYAQIEHRLSNPVDELVTSVEHCAKCHALALCPAARNASMNAIDAATTVFDDTLDKSALTHQLATLRHAGAMIENRRAALEELVKHRIKSGEVFEGWALNQRYGQRRWKPGVSGRMLSVLSGVDLVKDGIVTPAEAQRRGVSEAVINKLVDRPLIEPKLEQIDADARARAAFGDVS